MHLPSFKSVLFLVLILSFSLHASLYAQTYYEDKVGFEAALTGVTTIDFEGIATVHGGVGAVELVGDEFPFVTLTVPKSYPSSGLFVGIPDDTVGRGNDDHFFAHSFVPTSGVACFSPKLRGTPVGQLKVDFDMPTVGVGAFFLDVEGIESSASSIETFDGPGGTGNSLGKILVWDKGNKSQAFAGIVASGIRSAVFVIGGPGDGAGIDDLCFGLVSVDIDIQPGTDPNSLNINGNGVIPVAINGSAEFDVITVDVATLLLNGSAVRMVGKNTKLQVSYEDWNADGFLDLVAKFQDDPSNWEEGATEAVLTGELLDGTPIQGIDAVNIVP